MIIKHKVKLRLAVCLVLLQSCNVPDMSPEYSVSSIRLSNGREIFFKREVRGITGSYDVIAISADGDPCRSYDRQTDYCICISTDRVYYRTEGDTLHLFYSTSTSAPDRFPFQITVENHEVHPMEREKFKQEYQSMGITRIDLPIDPKIKCK
jgi:hypothetical protein